MLVISGLIYFLKCDAKIKKILKLISQLEFELAASHYVTNIVTPGNSHAMETYNYKKKVQKNILKVRKKMKFSSKI